jgi:hypothetical protein
VSIHVPLVDFAGLVRTVGRDDRPEHLVLCAGARGGSLHALHHVHGQAAHRRLSTDLHLQSFSRIVLIAAVSDQARGLIALI